MDLNVLNEQADGLQSIKDTAQLVNRLRLVVRMVTQLYNEVQEKLGDGTGGSNLDLEPVTAEEVAEWLSASDTN